MSIIITIITDNAAFDDGNKSMEVARILSTIDIDTIDESKSLRDINGNTVGRVEITD